MKKLSKKFCIALVALLMVAVGSVSAYAASNVSTVKAYTGVRIFYNGTELTDASQPYIINSTTYVPLRMIMNNFGKDVAWDAANKQVIVTNSASETSKDVQITNLQNQNIILQSKIDALEEEISDLEDGGSVSDVEDTLIDDFEDAGDEYFDDSGIEVSLGLSGDEDDLYYDIEFNFDDADDYTDLTELSQTDVKSFLEDVESDITSEIENTDYEDADITGKLSDEDDSSYYVKFNGSSYSFSWNDEDASLSDISDYVDDYFEDAGDDYFDDYEIDVSIDVDGDEDDLNYDIYLDFDDSNDYGDLSDASTSDMKSLMSAVKSVITSETENTDYEDAGITGILIDANNNDYYVEYDGSSYSYSW